MHLVFDIFQGIGVAAALGIRPFLPALVVGALAAGDVQIDFKHTDYAFLQSAPFLLAVVLGAVALSLVGPRLAPAQLERGPFAIGLAAVAVGLAAVLFAGSLCRAHAVVWPGFLAGPACALVGLGATRPLFARVRARLDDQASRAVPVYAEGLALALALLSVVLPPVGPVALALLLLLLFKGRGRGEEKYAGLRILR